MSQLPANINDLVNAMERTTRTLTADNPEGGNFIKLTKGGEWLFGADQLEVDPESRWAVNPHSFMQGFQSWTEEGELAGEELASILDEPILKADLPQHIDPETGEPCEWRALYQFEMVCITGEDAGVAVTYATTARGGHRAVRNLMAALTKRLRDPEADGKFIPIVRLETDSYMHKVKKYGKVYTPVFKIVEWVADDPKANPATPEAKAVQAKPEQVEPEQVEPEPEHSADPEPAPARRRRRARGGI